MYAWSPREPILFIGDLVGFCMATLLSEEIASPMDLDQQEHSPHTPPSTQISVQELSERFKSVHLAETPKSSRNPHKGKFRRMGGKVLFDVEEQEPKTKQPCWSDREVHCLISFLMLHTDGKSWTANKNMHFWDEAGRYIQQQAKIAFQCSGM